MAETSDFDLVYRYSVADDDLDSLFGGGDEIDPASLFIEAGTIEPSMSCGPDTFPMSRRMLNGISRAHPRCLS
ncbi:hypothetical protein VTI28DRAFT_5668 [Corynascus sepedonium]